MRDIADRQSLGILPLQHHEDAGDWPVDTRLVTYAARVLGRDQDRGFYRIDRDTYGPVHGGFVMLANKGAGRSVPLWAQALPAELALKGAQAVAAMSYGAPGVGNGWKTDPGLKLEDFRTVGSAKLPDGWPGVLLAGTDPDNQAAFFLPTFAGLVAPHWGGAPDLATLVYDTSPTGERSARLHSLTRVYRLGQEPGGAIPSTQEKGKGLGFGLALQLGRGAGSQAGLGMFADGKLLGSVSAKEGGPFDLGDFSDPHSVWTNSDGERCNVVHMSPNTLWKSGSNDAPLEFTDNIYEDPIGAHAGFTVKLDEGVLTVEGGVDPENGLPFVLPVELRYDPHSTHFFRGKAMQGLWRWQTFGGFYLAGGLKRNPPPPDKPPTPGFGDPPPKPGVPGGPGGPGAPGGPGGPGGPAGGGGGKGGKGGSGPVPWLPGPYSPGNPGGGGSPKPGGTGGSGVGLPGPGGTFGPGGNTGGSGVGLPGPGGTFGPGGSTDGFKPGNPNPGPTGYEGGTGSGYNPKSPGPVAEHTTPGLPPESGKGKHLRYVGTTMETAVPALMFRPQEFWEGSSDLRNNNEVSRRQVLTTEYQRPVVMRAEGYGAHADGGWDYIEKPCTGRYLGGVAAGGVAWLPGNIGMEHVLGRVPTPSNFVPGSVSFPPGFSRTDWATPKSDGSTADGFTAYTDPDDPEQFYVAHIDDTGTVQDSPAALHIDVGTETVYAFGVAVGSGGSSVGDPLIFGDGRDGDYTLTGYETMLGPKQYRNLTLAGYQLHTNGYILQVSDTLDCSALGSQIDARGVSATSSSGTLTSGTAAPTPVEVGVGGAGGRGKGDDGAGNTQVATAGGDVLTIGGGAGGIGGSTGGGQFGGSTTTDAVGPRTTQDWLRASYYMISTGIVSSQGGAGGGGGGATLGSGAAFGGDGGTGGGVCVVAARTIVGCTTPGTKMISVSGGNGANAVSGGGIACSGGGGGGGGLAVAIYETASNLRFDVSGGSRGLKIGAGSNGVAGSVGMSVSVDLTAGTVTIA